MCESTSGNDMKSFCAPIRRIVLVGHCQFDQSELTKAVVQALQGIAVESANDADTLDSLAGPDALLLVNRVLNGGFGMGSGIDLIAKLFSREKRPMMMLISNYPDAQAQAVQAGALPGFGKNDLDSPDTAEKLRAAAGAATSEL